MLDEIKAKGTESYRTFKSPTELGRLVRADLAVLLSERFAAGNDREALTVTPQSANAGRTRSIPLPSTSLIGREADIDAIVALLEAPENRLITLTGAGGIGKTRLAIAGADRLESGGAPRVTYVPLGSIVQAEAAMPRIASAVGATIEG